MSIDDLIEILLIVLAILAAMWFAGTGIVFLIEQLQGWLA